MTENSLADAEDTAVFRNEILTEAKNDRINDFGRTRQWLSVIKIIANHLVRLIR